jgi:hypothetical protein
MAEAFLAKHGGGRFEVESAGLEPGIDISRNPTKSVFELCKAGRVYQVVAAVEEFVATK